MQTIDDRYTTSARECEALAEVMIGISGEFLGRGGRLRRLAREIRAGEADHLEAVACLREAREYLGPSVREGVMTMAGRSAEGMRRKSGPTEHDE